MTEDEYETAYDSGRRDAWVAVLQNAMHHLDDGKDTAQMRVELQETSTAIVSLYETVVGQNLDPRYYLPDVIRTIKKLWHNQP